MRADFHPLLVYHMHQELKFFNTMAQTFSIRWKLRDGRIRQKYFNSFSELKTFHVKQIPTVTKNYQYMLWNDYKWQQFIRIGNTILLKSQVKSLMDQFFDL